jgi:hypothetical protein
VERAVVASSSPERRPPAEAGFGAGVTPPRAARCRGNRAASTRCTCRGSCARHRRRASTPRVSPCLGEQRRERAFEAATPQCVPQMCPPTLRARHAAWRIGRERGARTAWERACSHQCDSFEQNDEHCIVRESFDVVGSHGHSLPPTVGSQMATSAHHPQPRHLHSEQCVLAYRASQNSSHFSYDVSWPRGANDAHATLDARASWQNPHSRQAHVPQCTSM